MKETTDHRHRREPMVSRRRAREQKLYRDLTEKSCPRAIGRERGSAGFTPVLTLFIAS
jgi:hypothetical protein